MTMCRVLKVARSGFYQWLLVLIRASHAASSGVSPEAFERASF